MSISLTLDMGGPRYKTSSPRNPRVRERLIYVLGSSGGRANKYDYRLFLAAHSRSSLKRFGNMTSVYIS